MSSTASLQDNGVDHGQDHARNVPDCRSPRGFFVARINRLLSCGNRMTYVPLRLLRSTLFLAAIFGSLCLAAQSRAGTVSGIVTDAVSHQPVAGVNLYTEFFGFCPSFPLDQTVTGADGSYQLKTDDAYADMLLAYATGYAGYEIGLASGGGAQTVDIVLNRVAALEGTVYAPDASHAIPNNVIVADAATGEYIAGPNVDPVSGNYSVNNIRPGTYTVCLIQPYDDVRDVCYDNQLVGADGIPHGTPITIGDGELVNHIDIHTQLGATIAGTITDRATHSPIYASMYLTLYTPAGAPLTTFGVITDVYTGAYSIPGLAPGSYYLSAGAPFSINEGYYPQVYGGADCAPMAGPDWKAPCSFAGVTPLVVPDAGLTNVDFALSSGGLVFGRVVDATTGAGIPNALVAMCVAPTYYAQVSAIADANGNYIITHTPRQFMLSTEAGNYMDQVWPHTLFDDGQRCVSNDPHSVLHLPTDTGMLSNINFALSKGSHVSGTVSGTQGMPAHVAFFLLNASPPNFVESIAVNADGTFETSDLQTTTGNTYYAAIAYRDDGASCVVYGDYPCGPAWQESDLSSADFSHVQAFQAGQGIVILTLDFHLPGDPVFHDGFE